MASLGHVAVGLAAAEIAARWSPAPRHQGSWLSVVLWSALALLPDVDVVGFRLGVHYGDPWGHRGATHSLAVAIGGGVVALVVAPLLRMRWGPTALLTMLVLASHGLLDTLTDGGLGVALLWPFSTERMFAPWRPIPVAPIGLGLWSRRGLWCGLVELVLFSPVWGGAALAWWARRAGRRA